MESRVEVQQPKGTSIRIVNGSSGLVHLANGKTIRLLTNNLIAERISYIPVLTILSEYASPNVELKYVSSATVGSSTADTISLNVLPPQ